MTEIRLLDGRRFYVRKPLIWTRQAIRDNDSIWLDGRRISVHKIRSVEASSPEEAYLKSPKVRMSREDSLRRAADMTMMQDDGMTLRAIGEHFGRSPERVRQIINKHRRTAHIRAKKEAIMRQARLEAHAIAMKGRIDAGTEAERDKWHVWTPESNYYEMERTL